MASSYDINGSKNTSKCNCQYGPQQLKIS